MRAMGSVRHWLRLLLVLFAASASLAGACRKAPPRMTGAGALDVGETVSFEIRLACKGASAHRLEVSGSGGDFSLTELGSTSCRDDPALEPGQPATNFDTLTGGGRGTWQGASGAYASFTFADGGEGAVPDYAEITITAPDGAVVLDVAGTIQGNLEARDDIELLEAPGEDPIDAIHSAVIDASGRAWGYRFARLGADSFGDEAQSDEIKPGGTPQELPKIHPDLEAQVEAGGDPEERVLVAMNLKEQVVIPQLPGMWRILRCDDPLRILTIDTKVSTEIAALLTQREISSQQFLERFRGGDHTIQVVEQFWLVNGFIADVRLGDVMDLSAERDLLFIGPADQELVPSMVDGDPGNDIIVGRQLMNSDFLANQPGMDGGCIGLLDTGVHQTHVHFVAPPDDNLRTGVTDCDGGGPSCQDAGLPTFQSADAPNHGTGTASILSGNDVYGPSFRGVTDILVDSWKVYPTFASPVVGAGTAILRGFQRALESGDRVILAELQIPTPPNDLVATAADNAFDAGAVVLASAGNCAVDSSCTEPTGTPHPETIQSPANAHKVLGVGAYLLSTLATPDYQSYGPTEDLRVKPDIQTPTDAEAASQCAPGESPSIGGGRDCLLPATPDLSMKRFGGTSGSAPFATGVAALVRNRLRKFNTWQPGNTYAQMILKGDGVYPYDEREGAGRLRIDYCTVSYWGKLNLQPTLQNLGTVPAVTIPIPVVNGYDSIQAAIWWPETATALHDDVDLYLLDPEDAEAAKGIHDYGVFERVEVDDPAAGTWTLKIKSYTYLTPQQVYWALDVVGCDVLPVPDELPSVMP